jgi:hypothetical protein
MMLITQKIARRLPTSGYFLLQNKALFLPLFDRDGAHRTAVNHFLTITVLAFITDDARLPFFQLENFRAKSLAGSTTDTELIVDFWLRHIF